MYIIYVNHDSVIKQICQLREKAFLINETNRYDNPNATGVYFGGKSHIHRRLVKQRQLKSQ